MFKVSFVPMYIAALVVLLVVLASIFIRIGSGRYAENLIVKAARIRPLRRIVIRSYIRDLERRNPVAARAFAKVERVSGNASTSHTNRALSVLTAAERRAYLELFEDEPEPANRAQRRRAAKAPQGQSGTRH